MDEIGRIVGHIRQRVEPRQAEIDAEWERDAAQRRREEATRAFHAAGLPRRLWPYLLGERRAEETAALRAVRDFAGRTDKWLLVLAGPVGVGKTFGSVLGLGWPLVFRRAPAVARLHWYDDEAVREVLLAPKLVIDDLGTEYLDMRGFLGAMIDDVVNTRYDEQLQTVMTTNLTAAEFLDRYRERVEERLLEVGVLHELTGESLR